MKRRYKNLGGMEYRSMSRRNPSAMWRRRKLENELDHNDADQVRLVLAPLAGQKRRGSNSAGMGIAGFCRATRYRQFVHHESMAWRRVGWADSAATGEFVMPKKHPCPCKCGFSRYKIIRRRASYSVIECCRCYMKRRTSSKRLRPDCRCATGKHSEVAEKGVRG